MKKLTILMLLLAVLSSHIAYSHPGKKDKDGGHICQKNCQKYGLKDGQYHWHGVNGEILLFKPGSKKEVAVKPSSSGFDADVVSVIDGDTIKIKYKAKNRFIEESVRLLLIDTPETKHPKLGKQPFGQEASDFLKKYVNGKKVKVQIDVSERDKYGRLLAYIYSGDVMINSLLVSKGLARVAYVYPPNIKYVDFLRKEQETAKSKKLGIWSVDGYVSEEGFN